MLQKCISRVPPARDAPEHILNALNNDCIQEILRRLNITDFLGAAKACKRFQENAQACFPFKQFNIVHGGDKNNLPLSQVKDFLRIFGHLIKSINWTSVSGKRKGIWKSVLAAKVKFEIFDMIIFFCRDTLIELSIYSHFVRFKKGTEFKMLEKLTLCNVTVRKLALFPKLKEIKLVGVNDYDAVLRSHIWSKGFSHAKSFDWLRQRFPCLEGATFALTTLMTDDVMVEFQEFNSQLKNLTIYNHYPYRVTSSVLDDISHRLPNLISFKTYGLKSSPNAQTDLKFLMRLKNLKYFQIPYKNDEQTIREIIASFADNNVNIEHLGISYAYYAANDRQFVESVSKLKCLKELTLEGVSCESDVINIVREVPNLKRLNLTACYEVYTSIELPLKEIKRATDLCRNLTTIQFEFMHLDIDMKVYNAFLPLVKNRISMTLLTYNGKMDINQKVLEENRKWLDVGKSKLPKVFFRLN